MRFAAASLLLAVVACTPPTMLDCHTSVGVGDGTITIALRPDWAPHGVERVLALARTGFLDDMPFFRALPNVRALQRLARAGIASHATIPADPQ